MWHHDSVNCHIYRVSYQILPEVQMLVYIYEVLFYYEILYFDIDVTNLYISL